ncbi:hypothetical protein [Microbacterium testaceum]|uniref:hypothetical protein n=1 Tax=Microbacterium testaceum TaxID=2033 RepID=UPI003826A8F5
MVEHPAPLYDDWLKANVSPDAANAGVEATIMIAGTAKALPARTVRRVIDVATDEGRGDAASFVDEATPLPEVANESVTGAILSIMSATSAGCDTWVAGMAARLFRTLMDAIFVISLRPQFYTG